MERGGTHRVSGRAAQLLRKVLSTVTCKHDKAHDAAKTQSQLKGRKHHVARPAHTHTHTHTAKMENVKHFY